MDEKGCFSGNVTQQTIKRSFRGLAESVLAQMKQQMNEQLDARLPRAAPAQAGQATQLEEPGNYPLFAWGGRMHRLPEGYKLSYKGDADSPPLQRTAQQAYTMWHLPHSWTGVLNGEEKTLKLPPLSQCAPNDYSDKNQRKRRSEWKRVCDGFDSLLRNAGEIVPMPMSEEQCARLFTTAFGLFTNLVAAHHPSEAKRASAQQARVCALKVSTTILDMRKLKEHMPQRQ